MAEYIALLVCKENLSAHYSIIAVHILFAKIYFFHEENFFAKIYISKKLSILHCKILTGLNSKFLPFINTCLV